MSTFRRRKRATQDPQLVIFDCDGVLVDSLAIACALLARMLTAEGLRTTLTEARRDYQELLLADVVSRVEAKLGRRLPHDWLERYERDRAEAFRRELTAIEGAAETVLRVFGAAWQAAPRCLSPCGSGDER